MFNRFKSRQHALLGVDVSSASVKIMQITGSFPHQQIQAYASALLPVIGNQVIKDNEAISSTIKHLLEQGNFNTNQAAIAVSDASVITKKISVHKGLRDDEMEELVSLEIEKSIPYAIQEVRMDFVAQEMAENPDMLDVLVVASRSENLDYRVQALSQAGLDVKIVDVESYAVARAIELLRPQPNPGNRTAVIDIGATHTRMTVLQGLKIIFTREEEFGARQLIEVMMQHYDISYEKAVQMKQYEEEPGGYEKQVGEAFKASILLQIKRMFQFVYSTGCYGQIDTILLAGWIARENGLVDFLQENLNIAVALVNPFRHISLEQSINTERLYKEAPSLMVACGLALRCNG